MMFIDELRKCDPTKFIQAPTQEEDPKRQWVSTTIGMFLAEYDQLARDRDRLARDRDRLARDRDRYKQLCEYWLEAATGITPQHWNAP